MSKLFTSTGILRYSGKYRLVVEIDKQLACYYRSLIPKWIDNNKPRWPAHITVVRAEKEIPSRLENWGRHQGEEVEFQYDGSMNHGKIYFWLNVFSNKLEEIRYNLGLPVTSEWTRPPEGYTKCFHCTVANTK